jgi:hypothetical protein
MTTVGFLEEIISQIDSMKTILKESSKKDIACLEVTSICYVRLVQKYKYFLCDDAYDYLIKYHDWLVKDKCKDYVDVCLKYPEELFRGVK